MEFCNIKKHNKLETLLEDAHESNTRLGEQLNEATVRADEATVRADEATVRADEAQTLLEDARKTKAKLERTLKEIEVIIESLYKNNLSFTSVMTRTFGLKYKKSEALEKAQALGLLTINEGYGAKLTEFGSKFLHLKGETVQLNNREHKAVIEFKYFIEYLENKRLVSLFA